MTSTGKKNDEQLGNQKADFAMRFDERYKKLNAAQRKAVDTIDGPLLVVAGPGSGKTEILSMRVAQILKQTQAFASNILCLTFTDSASQNMRERLARLIGQRAYQVSIHTFHNFCVDIIRKHGEFFYQGATFRPADPITQISVLETLFAKLEHDNPLRSYHPEEGFVYLRAVQNAISHIKKSGLAPFELKEILDDNSKGFETIMQTAVPCFEDRLSKKTFDAVETVIGNLAEKGAKRLKDAAIERVKNADEKENSRVLSDIRRTFHSIEESVASSIADALGEAKEKDSTEPLSKWKQKWIVKDDSGKKVFKDMLNVEKMQGFAHIYEAYQAEMHKQGYFDFDDMILDVIQALSKNARLRYELQEQFQYLLVDEFQDTNNAQMRILSLLTNAPEHGGRPNIMVVGDDDQAIYKFQGAELSNILDFKHRYIDVSLVSMTDNYRSTQSILDLAMSIMRKGEKRLENLIPELSKQLVSFHSAEKAKALGTKNGTAKSGSANGIGGKAGGSDIDGVGETSVSYAQFETHLHEYKFIAQKIRQLIDSGLKPEDIAVIGRKHGNLEAILPFLRNEKIPIKYEREQNVFAEPHIREIITVARYISSVIATEPHQLPQENLLPTILSFAFWEIPRIDIWNISIQANREKKTWLEIMSEYSAGTNPSRIRRIAEFLIELSVDAKSTPLELMLDKIIGAHVAIAVDSEKDDEEPFGSSIQAESSGDSSASASAEASGGAGYKKYMSPFRSYYFSTERFSHARSEYLSFLSSLRVFINAIRAFDGFETLGQHLTIADLVRFVDMYEKNGLTLNDESPFVTARSAINLMSAHKSKGLEFHTVFVLSCQDDVWASRGGGLKMSFPLNLPIEPAGDSEDDQLRLFYVAVTRAKEQLFLTAHEVKEGGKKASTLRFLVDSVSGNKSSIAKIDRSALTAPDGSKIAEPDPKELLESAYMTYHTTSYLDEEDSLLHSLVEHYKLSVTHLNNFLNIPKGGPRLFFEQNLLRFPQSRTPSGAFGSAIHSTLECVLLCFKRDGHMMPIDEIKAEFEKFLLKEKLHPDDFRIYIARGKAALEKFIEAKGSLLRSTDIPELDFANEAIAISGSEASGASDANDRMGSDDTMDIAFITGKIDKVSLFDKKEPDGGCYISVHDYKTGRAFESFEEVATSAALKAHHYKNQLLFYKILIESSAYCREILFPKLYSELNLGPYSASSMKVSLGTIEFVEPVGSQKKIYTVNLDLEDEEASRLKRLAHAVYKRIQNLNFEIPKEIFEKLEKGEYKNEIDSITDFEEYLLNE